MSRHYELVIVGAGPAGLAAATVAADLGMSVLLLDEQSTAGGLIYRSVMASPFTHLQTLGDEYLQGVALIEKFRRSTAVHVPDASVFAVTKTADGACEVAVTIGSEGHRRAEVVIADAVMLATGAQERPFAIPGWTLPGVMTAGAAQLLLKTSGLVPSGRLILAGTGPLLWLLASQYLKAGVAIEAMLDTAPKGRYAEAATHALGFLTSDYFARGFRLVREVKARVKVIENVTALAAGGTDRITSVRYEVNETTHEVPADTLLLHQGAVPNLNLSNAIGCAQHWNDLQKCWEPTVDGWGGTSVPNVFVAGDGASVAGAEVAEASGRLAALAIANALGRIDAKARDQAATEPRHAVQRALRGRRFFDTLYRPAHYFRIPRGDTIVCRCEQVSAREIVEAVAAGCAGPNQMKAYTRCGMGPCQGRLCGLTVTEIIARERKLPPSVIGHYRLRFPVKPVTLAELAALPTTVAAQQVVDRGESRPLPPHS